MKYKKRRSRKALNLTELQLKMSDAILHMEEIIFTSDCQQKKIQAVNAISGIVGKYVKILEAFELEKRITKLEVESES